MASDYHIDPSHHLHYKFAGKKLDRDTTINFEPFVKNNKNNRIDFYPLNGTIKRRDTEIAFETREIIDIENPMLEIKRQSYPDIIKLIELQKQLFISFKYENYITFEKFIDMDKSLVDHVVLGIFPKIESLNGEEINCYNIENLPKEKRNRRLESRQTKNFKISFDKSNGEKVIETIPVTSVIKIVFNKQLTDSEYLGLFFKLDWNKPI